MISDIEVKIDHVFFDQIKPGEMYLRFTAQVISGAQRSFVAYYYPDQHSTVRIPIKFSLTSNSPFPISIPLGSFCPTTEGKLVVVDLPPVRSVVLDSQLVPPCCHSDDDRVGDTGGGRGVDRPPEYESDPGGNYDDTEPPVNTLAANDCVLIQGGDQFLRVRYDNALGPVSGLAEFYIDFGGIQLSVEVDQECLGAPPNGELLFRADGAGGNVIRYKYRLTDGTGSTAWQHEPHGASWPPPQC